MTKFKLLSSAATLAIATVSAAGADEPIKIGIDAAYKPYAYVEPSGQLAGFEVELIETVCAQIKAECELSNVPWDGIFTALDSGTIDMIGTTITKTPERLEKYDASRTIYRVGYAFLVPAAADTAGGLDSLKGEPIGTIVGTEAYYKYIKDVLGADTDIRGYDTADAAVLDLDAGRISAFMSDNLQLGEQFVSTGNYKLAADATFDAKYTGDGRGWIFAKGSDAQVARIDEGLDAVIAAGVVDELGMKYFNTDLETK